MDPSLEAWPALKGRYPFRLGTTSYIVPAPILPNIRFLAPLVDEVEIVLFESGREDNLPAPGEITEMGALGEERGLTYNIHLPTGLSLGAANGAERRRACETILRFCDRTRPLGPTVWVLHLEEGGLDGPCSLGGWRERLALSLRDVLAGGLDRSRTVVENLGYPLEWIRPLVEESGLSWCLDVGHILAAGEDLAIALDVMKRRVEMIHLHGLMDGRDHRSAAAVPEEAWRTLRPFLAEYRGGLSVEVFSKEDLRTSLLAMEERL
ncbi:MAG: sugar phosphate isomerase/epimerase [Syntrophaceae bacterium]|nr:sugar phosphate isomerase/epimerase [Syntrophaceae bacterium]